MSSTQTPFGLMMSYTSSFHKPESSKKDNSDATKELKDSSNSNTNTIQNPEEDELSTFLIFAKSAKSAFNKTSSSYFRSSITSRAVNLQPQKELKGEERALKPSILQTASSRSSSAQKTRTSASPNKRIIFDLNSYNLAS